MVAENNNQSSLQSRNFNPLAEVDGTLVEYAVRAERYISDDPNTSLVKARQFAELLGRHAAAYSGLETTQDHFADVVNLLKRNRIITASVVDQFERLRCWGNEATHAGRKDMQTAWKALITTRDLASWFCQTF